jgi:hypothetical protein
MEEFDSYSFLHCNTVWNRISSNHSIEKAYKPVLLEEIENELRAQGNLSCVAVSLTNSLLAINKAYVRWFYFIKVLQIHKYMTWKAITQ